MQIKPPCTEIPLIGMTIGTFEITRLIEMSRIAVPESTSLIGDQRVIWESRYDFLNYKRIVE